MVAKLVFGLIAIVLIIGIATAMTFWYFNQESKREHEKDLKQLEHTERMMDVVEEDDES
jgi:hypothetical protein